MSLAAFDVIGRLGSGSFGTVFKVRRHADSLVYVIKSVRIAELSGREQLEAINEVTILSKMNSPFVVRYFDSFIDQDSLHIVMEYCNRGDLQTLLKKAKEKNMSSLKENVTWNIFLQIVLGLHYLHHQKILHRDLKTANVFLMKDDSQPYFLVKIGDLGVAKLLETSTAFAKTIVGTPYYLSPELCADQPYRDKSDCWALGVLLYECLTLKHPFEARNQCALIMKIIQAQFAAPSSATAEMVNLVTWLLQKDPSHRPSIRDMLCEDFIRKKLDENSFEVPAVLADNPVMSVIAAPAVDFSATASAFAALHPASSPTGHMFGGGGGNRGFNTGTEALFPSLHPQGTSTKNNNQNGIARQNSQREQNQLQQNNGNGNGNNNLQATMQNQMPVLGAGGGVARRNQVPSAAGGQASRSGRQTTSDGSATTTTSGSSAAAASASNQIKGNRVRGKGKKITSEKAKSVHQLQPVRRPSNNSNNNGYAYDADSKDSQDYYDMAQEKEAVRQLEEVLIKEAQSKTSYLRDSFEFEQTINSGRDAERERERDRERERERTSAKIIEYDLKLNESISRVHIGLDSADDGEKPFFYTEIDSKRVGGGPGPASVSRPKSDAQQAIAEEFSDDEKGEPSEDYEEDFEDDDEYGGAETEAEACTDEDNAYIDIIMQPESGSPQEKRRRGSSTDDDGFNFYSKEDIRRNIEDLIDLVNVSRQRAIDAMGQQLFSQVYDVCLDNMDLNKNAFNEEAIDPSSPFIVRLEEIVYDRMPERNVEEVLSVIFSVKVLIAMENRLRDLQERE